MKIILIDNSQKQFDGNSRNLPHLRGAELALINYAEELALINHKVTVLNNCSKLMLKDMSYLYELIKRSIEIKSCEQINEFFAESSYN